MIVLGDISGIQSYLFDVAEAGGGQAQRLRARSFFIQLVAESAALRVLRALEWPIGDSHWLFSGAGKFVLQGPNTAGVPERLTREQQTINGWLLQQTRGELRLTLGWADHEGPSVTAYRAAQRELQQAKARPWAPSTGGSWNRDRLVLAPLGKPCDLCRHAPAAELEQDDDGAPREVCRWCAETRRLGRQLPTARWLVVRATPQDADLELFGLGIMVPDTDRVAVDAASGTDMIALANLTNPELQPPWCPQERFLRRRLMAYVPVSQDRRVLLFEDLAKQAQGDRLLAVLKADVDSLGRAMNEELENGLDALVGFGRGMDEFFAGQLEQEIESNPRWRSIYVVFAGGDDLVMVGPWNVMLDFAGRLHELFQDRFRSRNLTLSAGLALFRWKRPVKNAVAEAERLLEMAKTEPESDPKDQLAAFGQMWKWKHHKAIVQRARKLVEWVETGQIQRGWLHTLLELCEARHGASPNLLATSRLAYHVERNYRRGSDARQWAECLAERFDDLSHVEVRYLPAIIRYSLTATRTPSEE